MQNVVKNENFPRMWIHDLKYVKQTLGDVRSNKHQE